MSDLKHKVVRGAAWSAIENWTGQGMSFVVFLVLARILGPADFGLVALASIYVLIVQMIIRQGFAEAIVQVRDLEDEHLDAAFWTNLAIGVTFGLFTLAAAPLVARLLGSPQLTDIVRWMALLFPLGALSAVQQALLNRRLEFKALAYRTFLAFGCSGATGITMALLGCGAWSLVGQQIVYAFVNVIALWTTGGWRPRLRFSFPHLRQLWRFGVHVSGMNLLDLVNKRADQYLAGLYLGTVVLGFYSVAVRIYGLMFGLGSSTLNRVAAGAFPRLQHEPKRLAETLGKASELTTCLAFPAYLGFAALLPEIVMIFFGPHWMPAVRPAQLLMVLGALESMQSLHGQVMRAMGRPDLQLRLLALNMCVNFALYLIFVHRGLEAMVLATTVRAFLLLPVEVWMVRRLIPLQIWPYFRGILPQAGCSIAMVVLLMVGKNLVRDHLPAWAILAVGLMTGALFYATALAILRPNLRREFIALLAKFRNRRTSFAAASAVTSP